VDSSLQPTGKGEEPFFYLCVLAARGTATPVGAKNIDGSETLDVIIMAISQAMVCTSFNPAEVKKVADKSMDAFAIAWGFGREFAEAFEYLKIRGDDYLHDDIRGMFTLFSEKR
jgi:hypothetical protein